jgi:hypothetical protein
MSHSPPYPVALRITSYYPPPLLLLLPTTHYPLPTTRSLSLSLLAALIHIHQSISAMKLSALVHNQSNQQHPPPPSIVPAKTKIMDVYVNSYM